MIELRNSYNWDNGRRFHIGGRQYRCTNDIVPLRPGVIEHGMFRRLLNERGSPQFFSMMRVLLDKCESVRKAGWGLGCQLGHITNEATNTRGGKGPR